MSMRTTSIAISRISAHSGKAMIRQRVCFLEACDPHLPRCTLGRRGDRRSRSPGSTCPGLSGTVSRCHQSRGCRAAGHPEFASSVYSGPRWSPGCAFLGRRNSTPGPVPGSDTTDAPSFPPNNRPAAVHCRNRLAADVPYQTSGNAMVVYMSSSLTLWFFSIWASALKISCCSESLLEAAIA